MPSRAAPAAAAGFLLLQISRRCGPPPRTGLELLLAESTATGIGEFGEDWQGRQGLACSVIVDLSFLFVDSTSVMVDLAFFRRFDLRDCRYGYVESRFGFIRARFGAATQGRQGEQGSIRSGGGSIR
nr:unnamed protein product [Digitaria exilis]